MPPELVLDALQAAIQTRTRWDEEPELLLLRRQVLTVTARPMPIPSVVWQTHRHPPTVLARLAEVVGALDAHPDRDVFGAAFRVETFAIASDTPSPEAQEAMRRRAAGGSIPRFEHIPGRIEQRFIQGVDLDGNVYMVSGDRQPDDSMGTPRRSHFPAGSPERLEGNVPQALSQFLTKLTAPAAGSCT